MKRSRKILAVCLAAALACSMSVTAFAAPASPGSTTVNAPGSQTIPVTIDAEATQLSVTVPTAFPIAVDPTGEVTGPETPPAIINGSYGSIVVSNITVKDNAVEGGAAADWHLAAYDTDMSLEKVDANKVGLAIAPKGGKSGASGDLTDETNTAILKTADGAPVSQELLNEVKDEWVIAGKQTGDATTDELSIVYDANVTAVSTAVTSKTVANIVVTVSWYAATPAA